MKILFVFCSFWWFPLMGSEKLLADTLARIIKDIAFDKFVTTEFNYELFLNRAEFTAEKMVPFQDTSNDTYFKIGLVLAEDVNNDFKKDEMFRIDKRNLDNYTKLEFVQEMKELKKKPWIPVKRIKEELGNCVHMKYGSVSENDFMYDKGMYGWMNIMKFSCALIGEHFYAFGMAFARTRFRLKQIYLRRQDSFWATSARSVISRDVQKIVQVFSTRFATSAQKNFKEELSKMEESQRKGDRRRQEEAEPFVQLTDEVKDRLLELYPENFTHTPITQSKSHSFNTLSMNVKSRVILAKPSQISNIVETFSADLSDEACEILDDCKKAYCEKADSLSHDYSQKVELHGFKKERAAVARLSPSEALLVFTTGKPSFKFEVMKKKTSKGIIDIHQTYNKACEELFAELANEQFNHEFHLHHGSILQE